MIKRSDWYLSEINEIQKILKDLPATHVIERLSFESRLKSARLGLEQELANPQPLYATLIFRGKPVADSRGIAADFGGKAASAFTDAFAAVAAGLNESLHSMGPIPDRAKNQLLITGTAMGSFGFEFELPASGLPSEQKRAEDAFEMIQAVFEASATGSDDDLGELVDTIHPRAVKKISEFLGLLSQHQAWCGVEFKNKIFRFQGLDQLTQSATRLGDENIKESSQVFRGQFVGVLPHSRTFEFQTLDKEVIKGKIGGAIEDPGVMNADWLGRDVTITLDVIQVGQGRERFTLNGLG